MEVRRAIVEDADGIARVHSRGWEVGYAHVFPAGPLRQGISDPRRWRERLAQPTPGHVVFVADDAGTVLGFANVGAERGTGACGELYGLYVDPDRWGEGIGAALLAAGEAELAAAGREDAVLWVLEDNPRARRFYERGGWSADGASKQDRFLETDVVELRYRKRLAV
ncbi:MAG TPA: GNAT family N-acetyltransferase [Gaiellaceae bacterium]|jgi:GNAT superfamily N-acetyltransferase|nr:GNAT family N-acetyltransferase [Gaiellaceae bacterium]